MALAHLLAEDRGPPESLWREELVSSRLLEYELWNRVNARGLGPSHGDLARLLLSRLAFVELDRVVLDRARDPFPTPVRTLDALHLATLGYLREQGFSVELASYDDRLCRAARAMGLRIWSETENG